MIVPKPILVMRAGGGATHMPLGAYIGRTPGEVDQQQHMGSTLYRVFGTLVATHTGHLMGL